MICSVCDGEVHREDLPCDCPIGYKTVLFVCDSCGKEREYTFEPPVEYINME